MADNHANSGTGNQNPKPPETEPDPAKQRPAPIHDYVTQIKRQKLYKNRHRYKRRKHDRFDWSGRLIDVFTVAFAAIAAGGAICLALTTQTMAVDAERTASEARVDSVASLIRQDITIAFNKSSIEEQQRQTKAAIALAKQSAL